MKAREAALVAGLLALTCAGCGDGTGPRISLVGEWDFIGFTDAGVAAVATGTWTFAPTDSFSVRGTVTFPGEPTDSVIASGTYSQQRLRVQMTSGAETASWTIAGMGGLLVLTEIEPAPANTIMLRRR